MMKNKFMLRRILGSDSLYFVAEQIRLFHAIITTPQEVGTGELSYGGTAPGPRIPDYVA
jgi:hypothetical protein